MSASTAKPSAPKLAFKYKPQWGVIVICESERHQAKTYRALSGQGYKLKVVTV